MPSIADFSIVAEEAEIASSARIGAFCRIYPNVVLEDDVEIGDHCVIGHPSPLADASPLVIGRNSLIRSNSIFYEGSRFGEGLVTGHHVTVREGIAAGRGLQIGTLSDFQGDLQIGDYVRTHSNVHIGRGCVIEDFVWIFPYVVFTNDPHPPSDGHHVGVTVRRYAVISIHACIMPGLEIGEDALVGAAALVNHDVLPRTVVGGVPAKFLCSTDEIKLRGERGENAYPWRRHFHRGYPEDVVSRWKAEFEVD